MTIAHTAARTGDNANLPSDWASILDSSVPDLGAVYDSDVATFPERRFVFRAFWSTPLDQVRVVLLGQDPYDKAGLADGLAFSQSGPIDKKSALHRLFLNLERDKAISFSRPVSGDLAGWADQGVLLLNSALTVTENKPKSHLKLWEGFVETVLRHFDNPDGHVAFILLGGDAVDLALSQLGSTQPEAIIRAAHPMAGDPGKERPFHKAHVFSEANAFLGPERAVDWRLP